MNGIDPHNLVISLDAAERFRSAGWRTPNTFFVWYWYMGDDLESAGYRLFPRSKVEDGVTFKASLAAPTAEELWSALPYEVKLLEGDTGTLTAEKAAETTSTAYEVPEDEDPYYRKRPSLVGALEATALAMIANGFQFSFDPESEGE